MAVCEHCKGEIPPDAKNCPHCGAPVPQSAQSTPQGQTTQVTVNIQGAQTDAEPKDWLTALLLAIFLGVLGIHRFYTGHIGIGIVQLLTAGGCGIWTLIDIIMIATGSFKDKNGLPLKKS